MNIKNVIYAGLTSVAALGGVGTTAILKSATMAPVVHAAPVSNSEAAPNPARVQNTVPSSTQVNIHKLEASSYNEDALSRNLNGNPLDPDTDYDLLGTDVAPLPGVEFSYITVSEDITTEQLNNGTFYFDQSSGEATLTIEGQTQTFSGEDIIEIPGATNESGTVVWDMPQAPSGQQYLVFESAYTPTEEGKAISGSLAVPFLIAGTLSASDGSGYLNEVDIYPKNTTGLVPTPGKDVNVLGDNDQGFAIGELVPFYLKGTIPTDIQNYESYQFEDQLSDSLDYQGVSGVSVAGVDLVEGTHYTVEAPEVGTPGALVYVSLTAEGIQFVADTVPLANRGAVNSANIYDIEDNTAETPFIQVDLNAKINESAIMGQPILNDVIINYDNRQGAGGEAVSEPSDEVRVYTGGKHFVKVDGESNETLANARFALYSADDSIISWTQDLIDANISAIEEGKFAIPSDNDLGNGTTYTNTSASALPSVGSPIILNSGSDGAFEIKGLAYQEDAPQTYFLREVQAPEGYKLRTDTVEFQVDGSSYYQDPTVVDLVNAEPTSITNNTTPMIPDTGGIGSVILVATGVAGVAGTAYYAKKRKNETDEDSEVE